MNLNPLDALVSVGGKLIERLIPDPAAKAEAQFKLLDMAQKGELAELAAETDLLKGQIEVNKEEAKSANLFVAGWRPAVGWVCAFNLGWTWVLAPLLNWIASLFGQAVAAPALPAEASYPIILGMLGIGAMRSFEKSQGVATSVGGRVLTPVHKATPAPGAVAPQDSSATPPPPEVPVQGPPAAPVASSHRWIGGA